MNTDILWTGQYYVIFLAEIMIIGYLAKRNSLFVGLFNMMGKLTSSNRGAIVGTSALAGVLPVPGRVTITAGILDSVQCVDISTRGKLGIVDYLATHHYYLWSPVEKSVIIPMAALGISYMELISYMWPAIVISLGLLVIYVIRYVPESAVTLPKVSKMSVRHYTGLLSFVTGIIVVMLGGNPAVVFGVVVLLFLLIATDRSGWIKHAIDWRLLLLVAVIILLSNLARLYTTEIGDFMKGLDGDYAIVMASIIGFGGAWVLGSSSRFVALATIGTLAFGMEYFVWFFILDFIAYLLSPMHKCMAIGCGYFKTPIVEYYKMLLVWSLFLGIYAISTLLV